MNTAVSPPQSSWVHPSGPPGSSQPPSGYVAPQGPPPPNSPYASSPYPPQGGYNQPPSQQQWGGQPGGYGSPAPQNNWQNSYRQDDRSVYFEAHRQTAHSNATMSGWFSGPGQQQQPPPQVVYQQAPPKKSGIGTGGALAIGTCHSMRKSDTTPTNFRQAALV